MAFDYKKEYKEFYLPKAQPQLVTVPPMNYIAVRGQGDPNEEGGAYKAAIGLLYGVAFTIKMSKHGDHRIDGYFDYVVPPLEGFWRQPGTMGFDYANKQRFEWISVIRLPDFVARADFDWAVSEAAQKKKQDFSAVEFLPVDEGLCGCCTWGPLTMSLPALRKWMPISPKTAMKMTFRMRAGTMKSICPTRARWLRNGGKP